MSAHPACRFASAAPDDEIVYGACAPGFDRGHAPTVEDWIEFVTDRGIERVCCLLSSDQVQDYDGLLTQYRAAFGADRITHAPITDHTLAPSKTLTEEILPALGRATTADEPIIVHCKAGIGRTGQALAAWLVYAHEYTPTEAIVTVENRHRHPTDAVRAGNATREDLLDLLDSVGSKNDGNGDRHGA